LGGAEEVHLGVYKGYEVYEGVRESNGGSQVYEGYGGYEGAW